MFLAATEKSNAHMLLLISDKVPTPAAPLRIPPSLQAQTETQPLTDEAEPAPVCETPPLSLALCLTTSALH